MLAALAVEVWLDTYAPEGISPVFARHVLSEYSPEAMRESLHPGKAQVLLCHVGQRVLGFARLLPASPEFADYGSTELGTLYVRRHHVRRGIGFALLRQVEAAAQAQGHRRIYATVNRANAGALAFYARCGWREAGDWTFRFEGVEAPNAVLVKTPS